MRERIQQLIDRVDGMELRQRIMLLVVCLAIMFYVADTLAIQPAIKQQKVLRQAINDWELKLDVLRERTGILPDNPAGSASSPYADMLSRLALLDARIREKMGGLLAPDQAIEVLKQVLEQEEELRLLEVNAGSRPLKGTELPGENGLADTGINRYQMQLQLEGNYLATLRYLRALEGLPWKFFWQGVDYEVTEYPNARITIDLYTLGMQERHDNAL
jgi:MSHA biogenesis protein MshJ